LNALLQGPTATKSKTLARRAKLDTSLGGRSALTKLVDVGE